MADKRAQEIKYIYDWAVKEDLKHKRRMLKFQAMYENRINEDEWPTESRIPIPTLFSMTEELLATSYNYHWPGSNMIKLTPMNNNVSIETVSNLERLLYNQINHRMDLKTQGLKTLRDCYKLGVGYGIIENYTFTPAGIKVTEVSRGNEVASIRRIAPGEERVGIRYRYINPSRVIPTPDGTDTNGEDRVSWVFFVDFYSESQFRQIVRRKDINVDVQKIIDKARNAGYTYLNAPVQIIAEMAGLSVEGYQSTENNKNVPVRVPVIKCYGENEHVWLANGETVIHSVKDTFETLRCPIVKATSSPDGDAYYPMSVAEATLSLSMGMNIWLNAMFDLMSHHIKPTLVWDKSVIGNLPPERGPGGDIASNAGARDAAHYLELPAIPNQLFNLNEVVQQYYNTGTGKNALMNEPSAGMVRGGPSAFESLLAATGAREKLGAAILESNWFKPTIQQILYQMQANAEAGEELVSHYREYSNENRGEMIQTVSVTHEDLMNIYDVALDLSAKFSSSALDENMKLQKYQAAKDSPYYDQYEVAKILWNDEEEQARLVLPREEVEAKQREREQAELEATRQGGAQASPGIPAAQGAIGQAQGLTPTA